MRFAFFLLLTVGCSGQFGSRGEEPNQVPADAAPDGPRFDALADTGAAVDTAADVGFDVNTPLPPNGTFAPLSFRALDAEYSRALDKVIAISATPTRAVHIVDPRTHADVAVDLPMTPVSISVAPDGKTAAVAHDARITFVDVVAGAVLKSCPFTAPAGDIVLAGNGRAYVSPMSSSSLAGFYAVRAEDCVEKKSTGFTIYSNSRLALHPNGDRIYSIERGGFSRIARINISVDPPVRAYESPYYSGSDYQVCPDPFVSEDGLRILTGCGSTFRAADAKVEDMTYAGKLEGGKRLQHLTHSKAGRVVVSIPSASDSYPKMPNEDAKILIHDDDFLSLKRTLGLAMFSAGDRKAIAHGRFVFVRNDASEYYVIVQADPAAGFLNDYGLITIKP